MNKMFEVNCEMNARGLDFYKVLFLAHFQDVMSTGSCRNLNDMNTQRNAQEKRKQANVL